MFIGPFLLLLKKLKGKRNTISFYIKPLKRKIGEYYVMHLQANACVTTRVLIRTILGC